MSDLSALGKRRAEELGLGLYPGGYNTEAIHKLLGAGAIAYGAHDGGEPIYYPWSGTKCDSDTHSALLIGIKPLKVESEERALLRQIVNNREVGSYVCAGRDWLERARALLEGGGDGII